MDCELFMGNKQLKRDHQEPIKLRQGRRSGIKWMLYKNEDPNVHSPSAGRGIR